MFYEHLAEEDDDVDGKRDDSPCCAGGLSDSRCLLRFEDAQGVGERQALLLETSTAGAVTVEFRGNGVRGVDGVKTDRGSCASDSRDAVRVCK